MPPVIYAPRKLPGIIRCPVDANPPVTSVRWEKDGYSLRIEKVCNAWTSDVWNVKTLDCLTTLQFSDFAPLFLSQYPGWSQMADGSIRVAEVTEDSLGTYTCVPYNVLGTMGPSPPATLVLKVSQCILIKKNHIFLEFLRCVVCEVNIIMWPQDPPYFNVRPGGEYRQEAGRELVIPCAASGDPEIPTIVWRKVPWPTTTLCDYFSPFRI